MSDIRFSGIVEEDMTDLDEEVFVQAGERVCGNLNYYGKTPYIFGNIEEVDPEYVAPEFWIPVLPESLEVEMFGAKIPLARLRELADAEREGRVVVLPCKVGDVVAWDNGAGNVLKLFVKAGYHDGTEARLLLKNADGKLFDAEPLVNHPALRYGAEAERALAEKGDAT